MNGSIQYNTIQYKFSQYCMQIHIPCCFYPGPNIVFIYHVYMPTTGLCLKQETGDTNLQIFLWNKCKVHFHLVKIIQILTRGTFMTTSWDNLMTPISHNIKTTSLMLRWSPSCHQNSSNPSRHLPSLPPGKRHTHTL